MSKKTIRLTAAQAMVKYIAAQKNEDGETIIAGCWAIFGHGNVAGLGEALYHARDDLATWRGHNEQTMAHCAIAYAKQLGRKRAMMVSSSIGPGATNMVTAAALAHANRLPVLLVPGDVFANRGPDPVLQQIEDFGDGTVSANDAFRPVTRYFDRISRPEHLLTALPRAFRVMTDPADCGPGCVLGVGTRFQDFTTGSWGLFAHPDRKIACLNVAAYDAAKHNALPLVSDARVGLDELSTALADHKAAAGVDGLKVDWFAAVDPLTDAPDGNELPTDMQVIGAVQRSATDDTVVMCAAGTMPGELHKLWKATRPMSYHMEYGFSCMGYEIAGAMGIKMAQPARDVICFTGDGTYMMANSEMATAAMMGISFAVVVTDNRGYGCINRLQMGTGGAEFNNLLDHTIHDRPSNIDFAAHAGAMGATSVKVSSIADLQDALAKRSDIKGPYVVVIDTDPYPSTEPGGTWWDVGVPEVSQRAEVNAARATYEASKTKQRVD